MTDNPTNEESAAPEMSEEEKARITTEMVLRNQLQSLTDHAQDLTIALERIHEATCRLQRCLHETHLAAAKAVGLNTENRVAFSGGTDKDP